MYSTVYISGNGLTNLQSGNVLHLPSACWKNVPPSDLHVFLDVSYQSPQVPYRARPACHLRIGQRLHIDHLLDTANRIRIGMYVLQSLPSPFFGAKCYPRRWIFAE